MAWFELPLQCELSRGMAWCVVSFEVLVWHGCGVAWRAVQWNCCAVAYCAVAWHGMAWVTVLWQVLAWLGVRCVAFHGVA